MNPSTGKARALVDEWVRGGVVDVVACPGSRNAPVLLALHDADREGALRLHVRIDERGAGFLAAGLAARSGRVVPVVVTSGTAVANLHPAVLEASHAGVALLVVSADRPLELVPTGANQTVDQAGLFGRAVRGAFVLGPDDDRPGAEGLWRSTAVRALDRASGASSGDPGPVQLDVPLREPLLPGRETSTPRDDGAPRPGGRADGAPWTRVPAREVTLAPLAPAAGRATLVVAGHGGGFPGGARLPDGVPVLAEPSAPAWADPRGGRVLPGGPRVLGVALDGDRPDLCPDQVVVLGRPTLHRSVSRLLADPGVRVLEVPALAPDGRPRPGWTDTAGAVAEVGALPSDPASWAPDPAFARAWADAGALATSANAPSLTADDRMTAASGGALAAATVAALPAGSLLVLGSSNPVRDVALGARPRTDLRVLAGRGVSGIDGTVSLAVGAALAHGGPAYALLGDLTFLHDAGGLHLALGEPAPELTLVVADDVGGGIFTVLEQGAAEHAAAFERVFATPHRADLGALCSAYGVAYRRLTDLAGLPAALAPVGEPGLRVVHVPIDRSGRRAASARADDELREALITAR